MPKKIAVLTSYMHQRNGDIVSAMSFIKSILAVDPDTTFEWVVKRDISGFQRDLEAFKAMELGDYNSHVRLTRLDSSDYQDVMIQHNQVIDKLTNLPLSADELTHRSDNNWGLTPTWHGWEDIQQQLIAPPVSTRLEACDLFAVIGNNHRLVRSDHEILHGFKKEIKLIPEYDLDHVNNQTWGFQNAELIHTGFGGNGVYIDENIIANHGLPDSASSDAAFLTHLASNNLDDYRQQHRLYYGYFFDNEQLSSRLYTVKIVSWISHTIQLAMDLNEKHMIDIVIPGFKNPDQLHDIYQQSLDALPLTYRNQLGAVNYDVKQPDGAFKRSAINIGQNGPYQLRLINPQRLERKTIQALLNDSESWVGLTGDASFVEGLMKGKLACYQVVNWKKDFFDEFLDYVCTKLPDSPLLTFYELQGKNRNHEGQFDQMRKLYLNHLPEMQRDAAQLATFIGEEKNLSMNIRNIIVLSSPSNKENLIMTRHLLTEGPLPKSIYTHALETITRALLENKSFTSQILDDQHYAIIDNIPYNLTQIIKHANFEHIQLSDHDYSLFEAQPRLWTTSTLIPTQREKYQSELQRAYGDVSLPDLTIAEMQAINIYTGEGYREINALLRNKLPTVKETNEFRVHLIRAVMCASGLAKIPAIGFSDTYRRGQIDTLPEEFQTIPNASLEDALDQSAKNNAVVHLKGFQSTSTSERNCFPGHIDYHFHNPKGLYIAPISQRPREKEVLMPPTQIQLTSYEVGGIEASVVSDLGSMSEESLIMYTSDSYDQYQARTLIEYELSIQRANLIQTIDSPKKSTARYKEHLASEKSNVIVKQDKKDPSP